MNSEEYDQLQAQLRQAWKTVHARQAALKEAEALLDELLRELAQEDARIAHDALTSIHSASRKSVVGE